MRDRQNEYRRRAAKLKTQLESNKFLIERQRDSLRANQNVIDSQSKTIEKLKAKLKEETIERNLITATFLPMWAEHLQLIGKLEAQLKKQDESFKNHKIFYLDLVAARNRTIRAYKAHVAYKKQQMSCLKGYIAELEENKQGNK